MSVADEIKARLDIVTYIQQYVPLKRAGRSWKACCPWHNERTPSFVVDSDRQSFRCFGSCAVGGDVISFAMRQNGWSFSEALQELGKQVGIEVKPRSPEERTQDDRLDSLRGLLQTAADAYHQALVNPQTQGAADALEYARLKRGFSDDTIQQYKIGYALPTDSSWSHMLDYLKQLGHSEADIIEVGLAKRNEGGRVYDTFRNRLMIPIRDDRGRVVGFGARALDPDDNPKYLNSPQTPLFDKSKTLFGLDMAKSAIREADTVVIVEGYMDAIQAHQAGFKNVVAQMGTALTDTQIRTLARTAKKIILSLDSDAAGQNATRRSLETAREALQSDYAGRLSVDLRVIVVPGAKDPDDLIRETPEAWAQLVANPIPMAEWVIEMETSELPTNATMHEREAVARRVLPLLVASEDDLYKKDNIQRLALRLRIAERDLLAWADEQKRIERAKPPRKPFNADRGRTPQPPPVNQDFAPSSGMPEPPDMPSFDYDIIDIPPPEEGEFSSPVPNGRGNGAPAQAAPRRRISPEITIEAQCLRVLFQRPESYYVVNRKLRELAGSRRDLLDGPLCDWSAEDFSQTDTRALMQVFQEGLEQDNVEPLEYLRTQADSTLIPQIEGLLADDLVGVRQRLRDGHGADLQVLWTQNQTVAASVDMNAELLEKALQLRARRLQREREELCFLQIDSQMNQDDEAEMRFGYQIALSSMAKGLIDAELKQQTSALRE